MAPLNAVGRSRRLNIIGVVEAVKVLEAFKTRKALEASKALTTLEGLVIDAPRALKDAGRLRALKLVRTVGLTGRRPLTVLIGP